MWIHQLYIWKYKMSRKNLNGSEQTKWRKYMNETVEKNTNIQQNSYSLLSNMFLVSIITFTAGCMCFEKYMPETFSSIYSTAVIIICLCVWLVLSFVSGVKKKWGFAVFSAIFWIVPQVIIYMAHDGP